MKTGYEIYIQKDLSDIDKERAKKFCQSFIDSTNVDPKKRYGVDQEADTLQECGVDD